MATMTRRSVPLQQDEVERIARIAVDVDVTGLLAGYLHRDTITSEAMLMRALVLCGLAVIERKADKMHYERLAASEDDEDQTFHQAMRARRREP